MTRARSSIEEIAKGANGPPPDFLRFRANQLHSILDLAEIGLRGKTVLEIGGGVSGQSLIMSDTADLVVCIDFPDPETVHANDGSFLLALERAAQTRLRFLFASAEQIPLRDATVDVVFSSFVFEHIADRERAVQEIARVLKPGGAVITNVPNVMEPVFRMMWYGLVAVPTQIVKVILAKTGLDRLMRLQMQNRPPSELGSLIGWLRRALSFPPHGEYPSHLTEITQSRPVIWDSLFERHGFQVVDRFAIAFESYGSFFSSRPNVRLQQWFRPAVARYGQTRLARLLGTSYCLVATKPALHPPP